MTKLLRFVALMFMIIIATACRDNGISPVVNMVTLPPFTVNEVLLEYGLGEGSATMTFKVRDLSEVPDIKFTTYDRRVAVVIDQALFTTRDENNNWIVDVVVWIFPTGTGTTTLVASAEEASDVSTVRVKVLERSRRR